MSRPPLACTRNYAQSGLMTTSDLVLIALIAVHFVGLIATIIVDPANLRKVLS